MMGLVPPTVPIVRSTVGGRQFGALRLGVRRLLRHGSTSTHDIISDPVVLLRRRSDGTRHRAIMRSIDGVPLNPPPALDQGLVEDTAWFGLGNRSVVRVFRRLRWWYYLDIRRLRVSNRFCRFSVQSGCAVVLPRVTVRIRRGTNIGWARSMFLPVVDPVEPPVSEVIRGRRKFGGVHLDV